MRPGFIHSIAAMASASAILLISSCGDDTIVQVDDDGDQPGMVPGEVTVVVKDRDDIGKRHRCKLEEKTVNNIIINIAVVVIVNQTQQNFTVISSDGRFAPTGPIAPGEQEEIEFEESGEFPFVAQFEDGTEEEGVIEVEAADEETDDSEPLPSPSPLPTPTDTPTDIPTPMPSNGNGANRNF